MTLAGTATLAVVSLAPARAQQPPPPQPTLAINQLDAGGYPSVRAVVTALDARGVPAGGLSVAQFQAFDGDTPVVIEQVQRAEDTSLVLSVVLVIDVSGSMAGDALDRAKAAAIAFADALGPNDQASVVKFSTEVTPVVPFTKDRALLTSGISGLAAVGGTALYEAVQTTSNQARTANTARSAIVLLTDGVNEFTNSPATLDGSLAVARDAGVPVFTIGFGATPDTAYLQALSTTTQGQYHAANAANVADVYRDIAALLRSQYVLTLKASVPADGKQAELRLVADIGGAQVSASAAFTRGTAAPPAASATAAQFPTPATTVTGGGGRDWPLIGFFAVVVPLVLGCGGYFFVSWRRRAHLRRRQLAATAPNPQKAAEQGVPLASGRVPRSQSGDAGGYLVALSGDDAGARFALEAEPIALGWDPSCQIVLQRSTDVAPRHAMVWIRDGKILLRNVASGGRTTQVANRPIDLVILDDGDEFSVGPHRFRADLSANVVR